jgi:hypothetical protein
VVKNSILLSHTQDNIRITYINTKEHVYLSQVGSLRSSLLNQREEFWN